MIVDPGGCMGRSIVPVLLAALIGCGSTSDDPTAAADVEKPVDALKALAAADPMLGAKLELDPSVKGTWWTSRGRWDDPSRRIKVEWGPPFCFILYPSTLLQIPAALIEMPTSLLEAIFKPQDTATKERLQRLGEESAERHYPAEQRSPR
jgi:hypothetical protein